MYCQINEEMDYVYFFCPSSLPSIYFLKRGQYDRISHIFLNKGAAHR